MGLAWPIAAGALGPVPHIFVSGAPITAADMNANFEHVRAGAEAEASVGATYCGRTADTNGQVTSAALTGWPAVRDLCRAQCGASPTAHMCSTSEIAMGLQMGIRPPTPGGWVSGGYWFNGAGSINTDDCLGWTTASAANRAGNHYFISSGDTTYPDSLACNMTARILCCD